MSVKTTSALEMAIEAMSNSDLTVERRQELKAQALAAAAKLRASREADPTGTAERHTELLDAIKGPVRRSQMTVEDRVAFVDEHGSAAYLALPG